MGKMDALYEMLQENAAVYERLLETEHDKYEAAVKNDIEKLDIAVSKEQVFYLKIRGLEQNRKKLMNEMNLEGRTLQEIIEIADDEQKNKLKSAYDRLYKVLKNVKKINRQCKIVIDVRLHRIDNVMIKLCGKENIYKHDNSHNNNQKSLMLSKKI